jgi:[acyl-carrier-protein] S-malonyltransferase
MGKIAVVFSGQGAQHSGMGRNLAQNIPESASVFHTVDTIRPGTSELCFTGSADELAETFHTQPCMFAVELAAASALTAAGIRADMTAGFSLGELSALTYARAVTLEDGFRLVCQRGKLMQESSEVVDSGMAAVIRLDAEKVEQLCLRYEHVYPVNYNCPGQISVAGLRTELPDFYKDVKAAGGRAVPLKVRGGFHSPFMAGAARAFGETLGAVKFSRPEIPVYSDYTGLPYKEDYTELLSRQICSPVRWQSMVEHMINVGADIFIELGPGKTLCGLISKINSNVRTFHVEDSTSLKETMEGVSRC